MADALILGKIARCLHCELGVIDVEITMRTSIGDFYAGALKKIHMENVNVMDSAIGMQKIVDTGHVVRVFVQPADFIKYIK